jgi:hypothetical protein
MVKAVSTSETSDSFYYTARHNSRLHAHRRVLSGLHILGAKRRSPTPNVIEIRPVSSEKRHADTDAHVLEQGNVARLCSDVCAPAGPSDPGGGHLARGLKLKGCLSFKSSW